ncbi:hypothetical protein EUGRSUZ_E01777, partial [Eucalyptus grandis]
HIHERTQDPTRTVVNGYYGENRFSGSSLLQIPELIHHSPIDRPARPAGIEASRLGLAELRGLEVDGALEEAGVVLLDRHLDGARAEAVGDGEHDLPHLRPELLQVDGAAAVAVEALEDGVVEAGELLRRGGDVHPVVGLDEAHRLEGLAELRPGEDAVPVQVQGGEPLVHALLELLLVADEGAHRRAVDYHHPHLSPTLSLSLFCRSSKLVACLK